MRTERLIFKNTVFMTSGRGLGDLLSFLFLIYFARSFGTDILGKYAFAMSIGGLLTVLITLGLNNHMVREVSKDKRCNLKYAGNLLVTEILFALIVWILIGLIAWGSNFAFDTKLILMLIGGYHVFYKLSTLFGSQFRAHEDMHYTALMELSHKIVILVIGTTSIIIWNNPVITLAAYPIGAMGRFLLGLSISVSKYGWPDLEVDYAFIKQSLRKAAPFFIIILIAQIYDRIGLILLTILDGESAAGIYSASNRVMATIVSWVGIFGAAIFPVMSRYSMESKDKLFKLYERSWRLMVITVFPLATFLFLASEHVIVTLFGESFVESVAVFRVIAWGILFVSINIVMGTLLLATNHEQQWVTRQICVYLGYGLACFLVIPAYGYMGLAYAKLISQVLLAIVVYIYIGKEIHKIRIFSMARGPVLACLAAAGVFYGASPLGPWLSIPFALVACVAVMLLSKGIQMHDLTFLKKILLGAKEHGAAWKMEGEYVQ